MLKRLPPLRILLPHAGRLTYSYVYSQSMTRTCFHMLGMYMRHRLESYSVLAKYCMFIKRSWEFSFSVSPDQYALFLTAINNIQLASLLRDK